MIEHARSLARIWKVRILPTALSLRLCAFAPLRWKRSMLCCATALIVLSGSTKAMADEPANAAAGSDLPTMLFVFMLASFIGLGVITRVSRRLHRPLMSLTNAISAIAVVGAIAVTGHVYLSDGKPGLSYLNKIGRAHV